MKKKNINYDDMNEEQLMTLLSDKFNHSPMKDAIRKEENGFHIDYYDCDEVKEKKKEVDEINTIASKIDVARKLDIEDSSSAAKKQLEKIRRMDEMMHTNVEAKYLEIVKGSNIDYDLDYDELLEVNIYNLVKDEGHDSAWLLDFVKCAVKTIVEQENSVFRMIGGKCEKVFKENKVNILRAVIKTLHLNKEDYIHKKFIKLIEYVVDYNEKQTSTGLTPFIIEKDLKKELLGMDADELRELLDEYEISDVINYNLLHCTSQKESKDILESVKKVIDVGCDLKDVENLTEDNDWVPIINNWLGEEESNIDPEFDPFNDDEINEIENRYWEKGLGKDVEKKRVENISNSLKGKTNAAKAIVIRNKKGEIYEFDNKTDCMNFLNTSSATFSKFLKGQSKLNKIFDVIRTN